MWWRIEWCGTEEVWTSAGVSAGIDLALAFIEHMAGGKTAGRIQLGAEYYPSGRSYGMMHELAQAPLYVKQWGMREESRRGRNYAHNSEE